MARTTPEAADSTDAPRLELDPRLFRHGKRPEWGVGLLVREGSDSRSYQFEDGNLRKIRKGYYKLLEPAEDLGDRAQHIRENLRRVADAAARGSEHDVVDAVAPFAAQVALFTRLYPEGFEDPEWIEDHRRPAGGSALKRHRSPIAAEVRDALSASRFEEALSADGRQELLQVVADLLARTDLVPISHAKALRGLEPEEKRDYVEALAQLLHGEDPFDERFGAWLKTLRRILGERPSWRVATTLPGLFDPQTHVVVRHSAFIRQAGSVAPVARYSKRARVAPYRSFRRVAVGVRERLKGAGHEPRDLLDVHDFVWTTLRTAALDHLNGEE